MRRRLVRSTGVWRTLAITVALAGSGGAAAVAPPEVWAAGFHHAASPEIPPPAQEILAEPNVAPGLDLSYDRYLVWKEQLQNRYNLEYSVQSSVVPQWGAPKGGRALVDFIWSPTLIWRPFSDTAVGSGSFAFSAQQNQFWTGVDATSFQQHLGLLTPPSDWFANTIDYALLTYTHIMPGEWRRLSATIGQYSFGAYDLNQYAGNAQTNFVNYALAQNATQTYVSADLGAYVEAAPVRSFVLAGGFQGATNFTGSTITAHGLASGKVAYFLAARWNPKFLAGGSYGFLWYAEPALPEQELSSSRGLSFNAVQNLNPQWGLFLRANMATGFNNPIAASMAWGVIRNNPLDHDPLDQMGFGIAWNQTNFKALGASARASEWVAETYYNYTIFKGLQITPDVQLYPDPASTPASGLVAIFTLRATATF